MEYVRAIVPCCCRVYVMPQRFGSVSIFLSPGVDNQEPKKAFHQLPVPLPQGRSPYPKAPYPTDEVPSKLEKNATSSVAWVTVVLGSNPQVWGPPQIQDLGIIFLGFQFTPKDLGQHLPLPRSSPASNPIPAAFSTVFCKMLSSFTVFCCFLIIFMFLSKKTEFRSKNTKRHVFLPSKSRLKRLRLKAV